MKKKEREENINPDDEGLDLTPLLEFTRKVGTTLRRDWFYFIWIIVTLAIMIYAVENVQDEVDKCKEFYTEQFKEHCQNIDQDTLMDLTWVMNNGSETKNTNSERGSSEGIQTT